MSLSVVSNRFLTVHWKIKAFLCKWEKPGLFLCTEKLTFLRVLDSTENMLVKQRHSSAQEQAAEAEKQGFFTPTIELSTG